MTKAQHTYICACHCVLCGRYVHIGESHRGYLGTGSVDFGALFRALAAADYRGPLTFESFSSAVVSPSLSNTLCVWRNLCAAWQGRPRGATLLVCTSSPSTLHARRRLCCLGVEPQGPDESSCASAGAVTGILSPVQL